MQYWEVKYVARHLGMRRDSLIRRVRLMIKWNRLVIGPDYLVVENGDPKKRKHRKKANESFRIKRIRG